MTSGVITKRMQNKNTIFGSKSKHGNICLSRILYAYSHPENIQGLKRFPPVAAFIPFGGKVNVGEHSVHISWHFLSVSDLLLVCLLSFKFELQVHKLQIKPEKGSKCFFLMAGRIDHP